MWFWEKFNTKTKSKNSGLHDNIAKNLNISSEEEITKVACISGLMARVAYADFEIHEKEEETMISSLEKWCEFSNDKCQNIAKLAISEIKDLAGLEDHMYAHPLVESSNQRERFNLLKALFHIASVDGNVDSEETEVIRQISTALRLEHQHFIAARATVAEYLGALKN